MYMYVYRHIFVYVCMYVYGSLCLIPRRWMFHSEATVRMLSSHWSHGQFFICSSTSCHEPSIGQVPMIVGGSPLHLWFLQNHTWNFFLSLSCILFRLAPSPLLSRLPLSLPPSSCNCLPHPHIFVAFTHISRYTYFRVCTYLTVRNRWMFHSKR